MSDPQRWRTRAVRVHHRLAHYRRGVALLVYASLILAATALASAFSVGLDFRAVVWTDAGLLGCLLVLVRLPLYLRLRLGIGRWRFVGVGEVIRLAGATLLGSIMVGALAIVLPGFDATVSVVILEMVLTVALIAGVWISYRALFEYGRRLSGLNGHGSGPGHAKHRRIVVAGAGEAGRMIVHQMLRSGQKVTIIGFVDDDPLRWGTAIHRKEVIGSVEELPAIVEYERVDELLIAMPTAKAGELRRIVDVCSEIDIEFRLVAGLDEVLSGAVTLDRVREIRIDDLLGRDPIRLELPELETDLRGKTVLITGAAGSIGSELARQILLHPPPGGPPFGPGREPPLLDRAGVGGPEVRHAYRARDRGHPGP